MSDHETLAPRTPKIWEDPSSPCLAWEHDDDDDDDDDDEFSRVG